MTTVLVVCDVRIYLEGLADVLGRSDQVEVVGATRDAAGAIRWAEQARPDVILLDMAMPGSLGAVGAIARAAPDSHVVALSVPETEREVIVCAEAGVAGYVSRDASIQELLSTVAGAARGEVMCSPRIAASLVREFARRAAGRPVRGTGPRLTPRERQVIDLIDHGLSNKEIARTLHIALSTVKNHVHNILEKCQVHRRLDAVSTVGTGGLGRPGIGRPGLASLDLGI
jgi:two-component system, NarL family, nitrate/nitrite response regulator NarL